MLKMTWNFKESKHRRSIHLNDENCVASLWKFLFVRDDTSSIEYFVIRVNVRKPWLWYYSKYITMNKLLFFFLLFLSFSFLLCSITAQIVRNKREMAHWVKNNNTEFKYESWMDAMPLFIVPLIFPLYKSKFKSQPRMHEK